MDVVIDGVERQLLLNILAQHIQEQKVLGSASILNSWNTDAAQALFEKLQPQGFPVWADIGDYVELPESGQQYEVVAGSCDEHESTLVVVPVGLSSNELESYLNDPDLIDPNSLRWPSPLGQKEALGTQTCWSINPRCMK